MRRPVEPAAFASIRCAGRSALLAESRPIANSDRCIGASWRWTCRPLLVSPWRATSTSRRRSSASKLRAASTRQRRGDLSLHHSERHRGRHSGAVANGGGVGLATLAEFHSDGRATVDHQSGQVAYDVVASKRRLEASAQQEQAVEQETTRVAAVQYYDLVLAQAQVSVTRRQWRRPRSCSASNA